MKVCYKKSEQINKSLYHIVFLEICKSFQLMPKGFKAKKKCCVGGTSKDFEEKWDANLQDIESKYRDLSFYLMDYFWEATVDVDVDTSCLVKFRKHHGKIEREHAKTKRKKIARLSRNYFQNLMSTSLIFQFKSDFLSYCNFLCPEFENLYTLVTINKTSRYPKRESAFSQICQDESQKF